MTRVCDVQIDGAPSTISETAGSYTPAADGSIAVSVNGVQLFTFSGTVWYRRADINPAPYWNLVTVSPRDRFTNFEVWDEAPTISGVFIFGQSGTVQGLSTVVMFNLDGTPRTLSDPALEGTVFVGGDLEVTGDIEVGGEISPSISDLFDALDE